MVSAIPRNTRREAVEQRERDAIAKRHNAQRELDDIRANIEAVDGVSCCWPAGATRTCRRPWHARRDAYVVQLAAIVNPTPLRELLAERRANRLAAVR